MKLTLNWLKEYLETSKTLPEIVNGLLQIGLEVESVKDYAFELKNFTVAEILKAEKHPNADKLQICEVATSEGTKQIVCGASNARSGIKVIYAKEGTYIKGLDVTLKQANIRGVDSSGMMLSEKELAISEEHAGIIEVDNKFKVGEDAAVALNLNDVIIEVAITANIGYLLSIKNIAKDLAALGLGKFKNKTYQQVNTKQKASLSIVANEAIASNIIIAELSNVKNICSPIWMQRRLQMVGQKPISALVDITNYVMFELNHPMHVYNRSKLISSVEVEYGEQTDSINALNNQQYTNLANIPVIKSNKQVVAIAGIIGSSEHSAEANTENIVLECAGFIKEEVFKARKSLKINTDSAYRFERNVNSNTLMDAINMATSLVLEICGGTLIGVTEINNSQQQANQFKVSVDFINDLLGTKLSEAEIINYLELLEFKVAASNNENLTVEVPNYRTDIENKYSIAEVIMKMHGINNIDPKYLVKNNFAAKTITGSFEQAVLAKRSLAGLMLFEMVNMSFIAENQSKAFNVFKPELKLNNPISIDLAVMRGSLIPSLVQNVVSNIKRGINNLALFEVGNAFTSLNQDGQILNAAGILNGLQTYKDWHNKDKSYGVFDAKAKLFGLLENLGINPHKLSITQDGLPTYYHPSKSGTVWLGRTPLAYFGEIHPLILNEIDVKKPMFIFEALLNNLPSSKKGNNSLNIQALSNLMPFTRDFAFIVNNEVNASEIIKIVSAVDKQLITEVRIFDVYAGDKLEKDQKSIAFSVLLEPKLKTLNEEEITDISNKIINAITSKLGGVLRNG